jgi:non-haem Fe2+, alpha-ketoglutarate-dependent halogenase
MEMATLNPEAVQFFRANGYYAPVCALTADEASGYRVALERFERHYPDHKQVLRNKTHLALRWADELIRHPAILDAVEQIVGPNILCWSSSFFIKNAHDPSYVSWHQDSTYWGLEPPDIVTAWVALSESVTENGAMRVVPETHKMDQVPHHDTFAADNLLSRGQEIAVEINPARVVTLALQPGEMSLHHVRLVHGSEPNPSDRRRIGFAIRYLPTHVRQVVGTQDTAMLVRGIDTYRHFLPEQRPEADLAPAALAHHAAMVQHAARILMRETARAT